MAALDALAELLADLPLALEAVRAFFTAVGVRAGVDPVMPDVPLDRGGDGDAAGLRRPHSGSRPVTQI